MTTSMITPTTLARDNVHYIGTAARSAGNRRQGFRPAWEALGMAA